MSEKFSSSSETKQSKSAPQKLCYDYTLEGRDHVASDKEHQVGKICFDTDEKVQTLGELLSSEDEKQCLQYQIFGKNKITASLEDRSGELCLKKDIEEN